MKKEFVCFLSAFLFILSSCSNDIQENSKVNLILPKTIKYINIEKPSESLISAITYDGNKIVSIKDKKERTDFIYENNRIVKQIKYKLDGEKETKHKETSYNYLDNKLYIVETFVNYKKTKYIYKYIEDNTIRKEIYDFDNDTGKESISAKNEIFTFINGNITKSVYDWGYINLISNSFYQYDTNNNVFKNILGLNLLLDQADFGSEINISSANNMKRHVVAMEHGPEIASEPYADNLEYVYNSKGYPIRKTTYDYAGRETEIIEYTY
ncbi:hypothetical protein GKZ90_0013550 [Flavobacterium sp. MC2016-06]|uniref:hypothetical protein n=1 Tax=Flavobacterium sp. MC2016-06 TaxID=2676308 RepID=UPI0012BA81EA|nr:hypothetical protein [Flavobacterium sp. MC2016-06]MBU3859889.1 hypothetical protein [Flavobacterium sp. MC2016-06]